MRWTELQLISPSDDKGPGYMKRVTFKSKKTYVHEVRILWSSDQSPHGKIGPGTFDLPFQFEIPRDCLSSFEGSFGSISYALHGLIKTDGRFNCDHKIQFISPDQS